LLERPIDFLQSPIPPGLPFPKTQQGVIAALVAFVIVTGICYAMTHSRWSWVPGVILGLIVGAAFGG